MPVSPTPEERAAARPGDEVVPDATVVMDRACTLPAGPEEVWPWLVQLGKARAGWYLPARLERLLPPGRRALRHLEPRWGDLRVGDTIPDYGGATATFRVDRVDRPDCLVYSSRRGRTDISWALTLTPAETGPGQPDATRLHLRLRLGPVRHRRLAEYGGGLIDLLTIAGMAAGLRERLSAGGPPAD